jgi:hypothetical protein
MKSEFPSSDFDCRSEKVRLQEVFQEIRDRYAPDLQRRSRNRKKLVSFCFVAFVLGIWSAILIRSREHLPKNISNPQTIDNAVAGLDNAVAETNKSAAGPLQLYRERGFGVVQSTSSETRETYRSEVENVTEAAWKAFNTGQYENAITKADECIEAFLPLAVSLQEALDANGIKIATGVVSASEEKSIRERLVLNEVGACLFIKARALERTEKKDEAVRVYEQVAMLTHARCWERPGEFWSPAELARKNLRMANVAAQIPENPPGTRKPNGKLIIDVAKTYSAMGWMGDAANGPEYVRMTETNFTSSAKTEITRIKFTYTPGSEQWAGVYWLNKLDNWGNARGDNYSSNNFSRISFRVMGERGGEILEFKAGGISNENAVFKDSFEATTGRIVLSKSWKSYEIPLVGQNLSSVIGVFCWLADTTANPKGVSFAIEDIAYE